MRSYKCPTLRAFLLRFVTGIRAQKREGKRHNGSGPRGAGPTNRRSGEAGFVDKRLRAACLLAQPMFSQSLTGRARPFPCTHF